jgi:hypothetical protein
MVPEIMTNKVPSHLLWRMLACGVLALAFGLAVYRAKTQTIAHDEALEYEWFLDGSVEHVLIYNPANHVLFTLLAKPIVWSLGVTEFHLRVPSLLGAAIYLLAGYLLCRRLFGEGLLLFLSVALLALNPQIVDFMAGARGYILGLACLMVAMYAMVRAAERGKFQPEDPVWRWGSGIASASLALAVAATYTNVIPVLSLTLCFSAVALGGFQALFRWADRRTQAFGKCFLLPGVATGFCILWPYLIQTRPSQFYAGQTSARDAIRGTFEASLLYKWTDDIYSPSLGALPSTVGSWQERVTDLGQFVLLPLLLCMVTAGVILSWRKPSTSEGRAPDQSAHNAYFRIIGGAAVTCMAVMVALHIAAKVHYPNGRYGLFLIPVFTLGAPLAGREIYFRFPRWPLKAVGYLVATAVVLDYALCVQTTMFRYNAYDVISRDIYQTIATDAQARGLSAVRVGGTWWYEPEINFYRRRYKANWMMEYDIKDRSYSWQTPNSLVPADYDYFVFTPAGDPALTGPRVRTIFRDGLRRITVVAVSH